MLSNAPKYFCLFAVYTQNRIDTQSVMETPPIYAKLLANLNPSGAIKMYVDTNHGHKYSARIIHKLFLSPTVTKVYIFISLQLMKVKMILP